MTFDTWFKKNYPELRNDTNSLEESPTPLSYDALCDAYHFGVTSRDLEVSKLEARVEGLQLALQDKFTLNQIHKTFSLWRNK